MADYGDIFADRCANAEYQFPKYIAGENQYGYYVCIVGKDYANGSGPNDGPVQCSYGQASVQEQPYPCWYAYTTVINGEPYDHAGFYDFQYFDQGYTC